MCFCVASTAEAGTFGIAFFQEANVIPGIDYVWIALVAAALIAVLAYGDIRIATRSLLGPGGHLRDADRDPDDRDRRQADRRHRAGQPVDHGRRVQAAAGDDVLGRGQRLGVRVPVVRRLRGRGLTGRGIRQPPPRDPAGDPQRRARLRDLLHHLHHGADVGVRHRRSRRQGLLHVGRAARRSRTKLRGAGDVRGDRPRRDDQRVRQRPGARPRRALGSCSRSAATRSLAARSAARRLAPARRRAR